MNRKLTEEEQLDRDIEKATAEVLKAFEKYQPAKEAYDAAVENLARLRDKKNGQVEERQKEEFMKAFRKSSRSFEDVLAFLNGTFDEW